MRQGEASKFLYPILAGRAPRLASSIQKKLNAQGSLYIAPRLSTDDFRARLAERKISAVELEPFQAEVELEVLVCDDDLDRIGDLVSKWPGRHSIKLYSVSGGRREHRFNPPGPRAHYAVSLFPPHLAETLIGRAVVGANGAKVLNPCDAFLAAAYRATYLEAGCWERSGTEWVATSLCDVELLRLAGDAGVALELPITPGKLDHLLGEHGWRPTIDLLERAAHWMDWIREALPPAQEEHAPGLTVFFLRTRAVESGLAPKILECLRENGFDELTVVELDPQQAELAAREFRGGNWGRGPFRVSGGPPAMICVSLDLIPLPVDDRHRSTFPDCDNRRIADAKYATRDLVNEGVSRPEHYNPVHSTDNSLQAWRVIRAVIPKSEQALHAKVEERRRQFATETPLLDLTKHGRRAKVELVEFAGELAIRKTFRDSALDFMRREIEVMERLSPLCPEIPRLLDRGGNYIVMEYVGGGSSPPAKRLSGARPAPLPLRHVRKLAELIRTSVANGFDPIDLRADGNVIYGPDGLHLIDFEFWRPCDPATRPQDSMCLSGIPVDDSGKSPRARQRNLEPYRIGWYPYTLLSRTSFLYDPPWLQRAKRALNIILAYAGWASRSALGLARRGARRALNVAADAAAFVSAPSLRKSRALP
ncbi:MAG TPA: hypothetical protein VHE36_11465 [Sphingomicrobium sp.]|nr:hypothetical protein [Sphingomicrobium sp.]